MKKLHLAVLFVLTAPLVSAADASAPEDANTEVGETQSAFRPVLVGKPNSASQEDKDKLVKVGVYPFYDKLPRGEKCPVAVELEVKEGWHIHANPAHPSYAIPTELKLKTDQGVKLTKVKFPKHTTHRMKGEKDDSHVYDGKIIIMALLEIDASEDASIAKLKFEVGYQACNDEECRRPDKIVMEGTVPLANPGEEIRKINKEKFKVKDENTDEQGEKP